MCLNMQEDDLKLEAQMKQLGEQEETTASQMAQSLISQNENFHTVGLFYYISI